MTTLSTPVALEVAGDFQHVAGSIDTAAGLKTGGGKLLILQAEDFDVRIRVDGVAPTATVGHLIIAGGDPLVISLTQQQAALIKVIGTANDAILNVTSFK